MDEYRIPRKKVRSVIVKGPDNEDLYIQYEEYMLNKAWEEQQERRLTNPDYIHPYFLEKYKKMKVITRKVFSVCDIFEEEHYDLYDELTRETGPDCYVDYVITDRENDPISEILIKHGANLGEQVLIHIDY